MPFPWIKLSPQQIPLKEISGFAVKVALYLGALIDEDGTVTIPTACIASFFDCSRRSCIRALHELRSVGIIEKLSSDNEALRLHFLKAIKVGKQSPGEDRLSVRDAVVWGDLAHFKSAK